MLMATSVRRRRRLLVVSAVALVATVLLLTKVGAFLIVERVVTRPDAFVVLASHEWERFPALVRLARTSPDARILLTEPVRPTPLNCAACAERVGWLARLGIAPSRVVVLPRRALNTFGEAVATLDYARQHGVRRLIVITSPYHTRRSLATFLDVFRGTGIEVGVFPALPESGAVPGHWWTGGYDRWYVWYESAGVLWYAIRYGVNPFAIDGRV